LTECVRVIFERTGRSEPGKRALAFRSVVGVLLTALIIPPLIARIRAEETLLRAQFGSDYDAYRARTSRLIPRLY
jgi:protein-S-isoprenylcysteine O-methyltransferase Ste14